MSNVVVVETSLPGLPVRRGKVRDVYDLGDRVLLVSTDRISAFDWILPTPHPRQGAAVDADRRLLVRAVGRAEPPNHHGRGADGPSAGRGPSPVGRPRDPLPQDRGRADRVRGPRLFGWLRLGGISTQPLRVRHSPASGTDRKLTAAGADLHPGDQGDQRP